MKNKKMIGFIVTASLVVGTTVTFAQNQADQSSQTDQQNPAQNQITPAPPPLPGAVDEPAGAASFNKEKFIEEVGQANLGQLNIAQLATQKAQDPQVKEYAQKLVSDRSKMNDKLKEIAQKEGETLPTEVDSRQQKVIDHLSSLSGAEFDKAFATYTAKRSLMQIALLKKASASDNPEIRDFAQKALPDLEERLRTARQWAPEVTAGTAVEEPSGAEKKSDAEKADDANKQNDLNKSDQQNPDQNKEQKPDDAGALPK